MHILSRFLQFLPNVLFLFKDPIRAPGNTVITSPQALLVTNSQTFLLYDDLESFEDYWSDIL